MTTKRKKSKSNVEKKPCLKCQKNLAARNFYKSNSSNHNDSLYPVCKECIRENLDIENTNDYFNETFLERLHNTLLEMNRPFLYSTWETSVEESERTSKDLFGLYMKNINSLNGLKDLNWKDSEFGKKSELEDNDENEDVEIHNVTEDLELKIESNKNREDVLRMLGYDPFIGEAKEDINHLCNKLIDFLDENTMEDGFKLNSCIEIVKGFNQADKINRAISKITSDTKNLVNNSGSITSLVNSKKAILASVTKLAEDNGISTKHNNNKSKGAGTLSGIVKQLQGKGIQSAEVNIYNVETCEGMKQVADISNKSIFEQLMLNENDYVEMIKDQREMILNYERRLSDLEEENRLIKIKLKQYENGVMP